MENKKRKKRKGKLRKKERNINGKSGIEIGKCSETQNRKKIIDLIGDKKYHTCPGGSPTPSWAHTPVESRMKMDRGECIDLYILRYAEKI